MYFKGCTGNSVAMFYDKLRLFNAFYSLFSVEIQLSTTCSEKYFSESSKEMKIKFLFYLAYNVCFSGLVYIWFTQYI